MKDSFKKILFYIVGLANFFLIIWYVLILGFGILNIFEEREGISNVFNITGNLYIDFFIHLLSLVFFYVNTLGADLLIQKKKNIELLLRLLKHQLMISRSE